MKVNNTNTKKRTQSGFTLIEMIGVLAVIAILAAVLIPKIFEAINNSRINNAAMSIQTVKTAIADHYAKFGSIPVSGMTTPPTLLTPAISRYDTNLVAEGFLDKSFAVKIGDGVTAFDGTGTRVEVINTTAVGTTAPAAAGTQGTTDAAYDLDGTGNVNDAVGSVTVHAVITGVTLNDARDLNTRIDGADLSVESAAGVDLKGRVKYNIGSAASGPVLVYLTHR